MFIENVYNNNRNEKKTVTVLFGIRFENVKRLCFVCMCVSVIFSENYFIIPTSEVMN